MDAITARNAGMWGLAVEVGCGGISARAQPLARLCVSVTTGTPSPFVGRDGFRPSAACRLSWARLEDCPLSAGIRIVVPSNAANNTDPPECTGAGSLVPSLREALHHLIQLLGGQHASDCAHQTLPSLCSFFLPRLPKDESLFEEECSRSLRRTFSGDFPDRLALNRSQRMLHGTCANIRTGAI